MLRCEVLLVNMLLLPNLQNYFIDPFIHGNIKGCKFAVLDDMVLALYIYSQW